MAQRPQPSLRLADGGSFITRWAQSVMRPNATPDNPAGIRFQDGGHVPGTGRGDKIPAKYEPGEFVVSNDMIDDNPGLREQLSGLRAETLAARGKTVEEADAKALRYHGGLRGGEYGYDQGTGEEYAARLEGRNQPAGMAGMAVVGDQALVPGGARLHHPQQVSLRAADGFDPLDRMARNLTGQNSLPPRSPVGNMAESLARNARAAAPEGPAVRPTAPLPPDAAAAYDSSPEGRATRAQVLKDTRGYFQGNPSAAAPSAAPANTAPVAAPAEASTLRRAASAVGNSLLYGGAGVGGALAAKGLSDVGAPKGTAAVPGERQAGDSATSTQIPTGGGGYRPTPGAQPYNFWTDSEAGRNIGNAANAIAPLGGIAMAARVPGAASKAFGVADAALGGLSAGIHNERASANTATSAATTLRTRPEDTFAGPPAAAAGAASPAADPGAPRRVDRPGQSPLFTNVADDAPYTGNNALMARGNGPNAQNMAAANNLAATDSLRSQGAALGGQPAGGSGMPTMPQTQHSGNSWEARNNLRNLAVSASSITNRPGWSGGGRGYIAPDVAAYQNAQAMDTAARTGSDPGSVSRNSAQASMFGSKTAADASKENSRNSLRGQMYSSDAQLGAKQMEMQQRLRQQQLKGEIFRAAGGKPEAAAQIAASYGLDPKDFTDMASASQTRDHNATTNARKRLEGMAVRSDDKGGTVVDPGRLARLESTLGKMSPGWQHMSEPEQAKHLATAEASVNLLEGLNDRRNNGFWQSIGVDGSSASLDKLPIEAMKGGRLKTVKALEGALTGGGVERKDYVIETEGGHKLYLPRDKVNQGELELLKSRGVDISSLQK